MALRAAALIVPTASAARPAVRLRYRWDDQLIPLPGARIVTVFGPIVDPCPPGEPPRTVGEIQAQIEQALIASTRRAEAWCRGGDLGG
jgi:hypothetical protein